MAPKFQCLSMMKGFLLLITFRCRQAERRGTLALADTGDPDYLHRVALPSPRTSRSFPSRAQTGKDRAWESLGEVSVGRAWK